MQLKHITCSDPRESIILSDMISVLNLSPLVEIGMQASPGPMSSGNPRNEWFNALLKHVVNTNRPSNIAVHVNYDWCDALCSGGAMPDEIAKWMKMPNFNGSAPAIRRWQLNIGDGTGKFKPDAIARLIKDNPRHEFIFPYNNRVADKISALHKTGANFSLLYDSSYGYGVLPDAWYPPVYESHPMGYAGGLSADNVTKNLNKISAVLPQDYKTWIDAEGRLMKEDTRHWDVNAVMCYIKHALMFNDSQRSH
jgi:hypothetical protein